MSEQTTASILQFRPRHIGKAPLSVRAIRVLVRDVHEGADVELAVSALAATYVEDGKSIEALYEHLDQLRGSGELDGVDETTIRLAGMAWADACFSRFSKVTCAEPMTGLAPAEHLVDVLTALHRQSIHPSGQGPLVDSALLIVDLRDSRSVVSELQPFGQALRLAQVADSIDAWFADAPLAKVLLGPDRVAVLVPADGIDADVATGFGADLEARFRLAPGSHHAKAFAVSVPDDLGSALALVEALAAVQAASVT